MNILEKLGLAGVLSIAYQLLRFIVELLYTYVVGPVVNKVDYTSKGKWALVTGCTDGIGKQYARELAAQGCDIVLVSRSFEKLKATSDELEKDFNVETKIIQVDFLDDVSIYKKIEQEIKDLEIGTLVNNVGMSYLYPEYFLDIPDWDNTISSLIKANIVSITNMTKLVLPSMVERKKGVIINLGSASSAIPSPLLTVYAATKAYVDKFTEGIHMEYTKHGIIVQCVLPGFVCSNMSGIRRSSLLAPSAVEFVKSSFALVGTEKRTPGYLPHAFFVNLMTSSVSSSYRVSNWIVTRALETSRLRFLKKYKTQ